MLPPSNVICAGSLLRTLASSSTPAWEGLAVEENKALQQLLLLFIAEKRDEGNCCCLEYRAADAEALQLLLLVALPTTACEEEDRRESNRTLALLPMPLIVEQHICCRPRKS